MDECIYCHLPITDDGVVLTDSTGGDACGTPLDSGYSDHGHCDGFAVDPDHPGVCGTCLCHRDDHPVYPLTFEERSALWWAYRIWQEMWPIDREFDLRTNDVDLERMADRLASWLAGNEGMPTTNRVAMTAQVKEAWEWFGTVFNRTMENWEDSRPDPYGVLFEMEVDAPFTQHMSGVAWFVYNQIEVVV